MIKLKPGQNKILITNIIAVIGFSILFISKANYEFMIYIGVIIFFILVIMLTNHKVNYPNKVLWGLTVWSILHMAGGALFFGGTRLYEIILLPIVGEPYLIFKYDQFVHIIGFMVATLVAYYLLEPYLKKKKGIALFIVVVMAGLGIGALNEIIEFLVTVLVPSTGVGGYENTSLDLVADLIGAIIAIFFIKN